MAVRYDHIDERLAAWIREQHIFFVGTAPSGTGGHINVSPKGAMDSFGILTPNQVAYVDMLGSGAETVAHIRENGRVTIMMCAFDGPPKILRLFGRGRVLRTTDDGYHQIVDTFAKPVGDDVRTAARGVVVVDVYEVWRSCGFTVPVMSHVRDRKQLFDYVKNRIQHVGPRAVLNYTDVNNEFSLDGLPAFEPTQEVTEEERLHNHVGRAL